MFELTLNQEKFKDIYERLDAPTQKRIEALGKVLRLSVDHVLAGIFYHHPAIVNQQNVVDPERLEEARVRRMKNMEERGVV